MSTAGILRPDEVVFYHPLDNFTEHTQSQAWTVDAVGGFTDGKIGLAASAITGDVYGLGPNNDGPAMLPQACMTIRLDSTHVLLVGNVSATVGTISGTDVTYKTPSTIPGNFSAYRFSLFCVLDWDGSSGHVVLFMWYYGGTYLLTITDGGDTITGEREYYPDGVQTSKGGSVGTIDSTHFLQAVTLFSGATDVIVREISGDDFGTIGPVNTFPAPCSGMADIAMIDSTHALFLYDRGSSTGAVRVGVISGTSVTFGPETVISDTGTFKFDTSYDRSGVAVALDSSSAALLWGDPTTSKGQAKVATISGNDVTVGAIAEFPAAVNGALALIQCETAGSGNMCMSYSRYSSPSQFIRVVHVSGSSISFGGELETSAPSKAGIGAAALTSATCIVTYGGAGGIQVSHIGELGQEANAEASTPGAYPSTIGATRVAIAMWASGLTTGSATVSIERGYRIEMTATSISLGGTTAVWDDADIATLMSAMNVGEDHLLVLDFENTGGTNWSLKTSIDGETFVPQGTQDSGTQAVIIADTAPQFSIVGGAGQWIDELVMWSGDKTTFEQFTSEELANLNDLASTFLEGMNEYESNYGAPICWQATARTRPGSRVAPHGTVRHPATIRVPRGASDVVVTDNGLPTNPRIQEG